MSQPDENDNTVQNSTAQHSTLEDSPSQYAGPPQTQAFASQPAQPPGYGEPTGYPVPLPPGYPASGYGPSPGPQSPPGYPPTPGYSAPYGYPPYGYPMPRGPIRPGAATASAVLMFIQGGIVLFSTIYVLFFAALAGGASSAGVSQADSLETEWTIIGILQLVSVGLLIFAGVQLLGGSGRILTIIACGAQLAFVLYWMIRIGSLPEFGEEGGTFFFVVPLFYAVLPVVALPLALGKPVTDYIAAKKVGSNTAP